MLISPRDMPLTRGKPKLLAEQLLGEEHQPSVETARGLTFEVMRAYWGSLAGGAPLRPLENFGLDLVPASEHLIDRLRALGRSVAQLSPLAASFEVGRMYMALLPKAYRSRHGIYFTPPPLADRLLDLASASGIDLAAARVLDPACGGGAFLAPVAAAKLDALAGHPPDRVLARICATVRGLEIDPFSAWLSQVFLEAVLFPVSRGAERDLPVLVEVCDALQIDERPAYDLIIGNPPYGRIKLSPRQRERFQRSLFGHANLYGLFTDLALRLADTGAAVAFVTPTSFLSGQYFRNLRELLAELAPPDRLEFISDRDGVFDDVLQEALLAVYRAGEGRGEGRARLLKVGPSGNFEVDDVGAFVLPAEPSAPWIIPRRREHAALVQAAQQQPTRLADLGYRVSTGPLVWNRHKDQLRSEPGRGRYPLIWAEAVTAAGKFEFRAEKKNHEPYFEVRPERDDWLMIRSPCVLLQRTTSKEQRRRLIAAELPASFLDEHGAAVIENHLNMIYPAEGPLISPVVPARTIAALFNSRVVDELFRCISGSVAVSAFELEALPLPSAGALEKLDRLLDAGRTPDEIDSFLRAAYRDEVAAAA